MKPSEWKEIAEHVERMLTDIQFGSITLVVQDGKVVQIEKSEKVRLQSNKPR
ncbi:YezD family protein [Neobacillus dielmonensis]|uniref:YezD family protein n=1 Tax=Neobacillus dielmonensis TaxID=1347369 RepID=UPI00222862B6|nr:YezD family protein [Neobacillus dielmonensis]